RRYVTISLPRGIAEDIDRLIEEIGYWPSKGAFVREACTDKLWRERKKLRELRTAAEGAENPQRDMEPRRGNTRGSATVKRPGARSARTRAREATPGTSTGSRRQSSPPGPEKSGEA
ncbi:MAG: ribbon-helix-helix domain-containing protein, partial [Candidatus Bathyarchaeota archaeon]|nr:ribbon-helix-helix domain-containing protein [Candidatus Bathyarchaeota archaeon]